jgi:hypothetical protein
VPVAVLAGFWAVLYLPPLLAGQTLPARDVGMTQIPWRTVWRAQVAGGSPPLWDPYSNGGRPLLADPNTMAAYPGTLLFLLASPEAAAAWHIALHHLLLILGCYALARRSGGAPAPAAVAAAAVGTCGVAWSAVTFLNFQASLAWGVWAVATAVPPPRPGAPALRRALAGGVLVGLSFLGGEPVTAGLAALTWAVVALATWRPLPALAVVTAWASAAALAAPVLLPLLTVYPETVRGSMTPTPGAMSADALAPRRFVELLLPNLLGSPLGESTSGFWAASSFPWQRYYPVIFVGVVPLLCLPFAAGVRRRLAPWWSLAAVGAASAVLLSFPGLAGRAEQLPFLGSTRYGIKFLTLAVLALPPLVAAGWATMAAHWKGAGRRAVRALAVALLLVAPAAVWPDLLLRPVLGVLYPASAPALARVPSATLRRAALTDLAALVLPPAALALAGPLPLVGVAATLAANALGGSGVLLFADAATWARPPAARTALPARPVLAVLQPQAALEPSGSPPIQRFWRSHIDLLPEAGTRWGAAYVLTRGPDGLEPIRQDLLAAAALQMPVEERGRLARAVGATALLAHGPIPGWAGTPVGEIWEGEVKDPSPPAYLARRLLPAASVLAAAATMAAESFRAGEDAVIDGSGAARSTAGGTVVEHPGSPHRRLFEISAGGPGLLVVQQSFMRCWRATVDGTPAAVEPANYADIGVRVPAGHHRVALVLDPTPYRVGVLGPLLLAVVAVLSRRKGTSPGRAGSSGGEGRNTPATPPAR